MQLFFLAHLFLFFYCGQAVAKPSSSAPLVSVATQDDFFDEIKSRCGKSYGGKVVVDQPKSEGFNKPLVMHIRKCTDSELQVPFHVGDDHSRTWIITKTGSGLSLKHDHRNKNGSNAASTMYGGHTLDAGYNSVQTFPADEYSKQLFVKQNIPESTRNIWRIFINSKTFSYTLLREGREFRVDFDLTKTVKTPPTPWGYR